MTTLARDSSSSLLRSLIVLLLDYFRWTQLMPMLFCWSAALLILFAMAFVLNQDAGFSLAVQASDYLESSPRLLAFLVWLDSSLDINSTPQDFVRAFQAWFMVFWSGAAFLLFLLGLLARAIGLGLPVLRLRLRLLLAMAAVTGLGLLLFLLVASRPDIVQGSLRQWAALYVGLPAVVLFFSTYSLSVSYGLKRLADFILLAERV